MCCIILTREHVRRVDRLAIQEYGMSGLVLMENAGRGCVDVLERLGVGGPVVIACGKGNNAGDGFVIARHLRIRGYDARTLLWSDPAELSGDARANFEILQKSGAPIRVFAQTGDADRVETELTAELAGADWIVDALLGTGARGEPRPPFDTVIRTLNAATARRLAVDLPSGLDCDTGEAAVSTFRADHTCTFVALKPGFQVAGARDYTGQVHVVDIGVPPRLIAEVCEGN